MSPFDRLDRIASRGADRLNAEPVQLYPMLAKPNSRPLVDYARERIDGRAIFSERAAPAGLQLGDRRQDSRANDFRTIVNGTNIELSVDRASNPAFDAHPGDHILLTSRGRRFGVSSVRPDGAARVVLILTEIET